MTGSVRLQNPEVLHAVVRDVSELRELLTAFGRLPHTPVDLVPAGAGDLLPSAAVLRDAAEAAIDRLLTFVTDVDRGSAALAWIAGWVAREFVDVDVTAMGRLSGLVQEATEQVPRAPEGTTPDARFASPLRLT